MKFLRALGAELIGLFVDDWGFALGLLFWVGLCALPAARAHPRAAAPVLFLGLAALLLAFVAHAARQKK